MIGRAAVAASLCGLGVLSVLAEGDVEPRFRAGSVCDLVAGAKGYGPVPETAATGLIEQDGLVRQGVLDLDGDGTSEVVTRSLASGEARDTFVVTLADGTAVTVGASQGDAGAGFLSFKGRWYLVSFRGRQGAFPADVASFERGTLAAKPVCRFDYAVSESMRAGPEALAEDDDRWCREESAAAARLGRLKPALYLNETQEMELNDALYLAGGGKSISTEMVAGREVYRVTVGPLAGALLWKVRTNPEVDADCPAWRFLPIEADGAGSYRLAEGERAAHLREMQAPLTGAETVNCASDIAAIETSGRFLLERHGIEGRRMDDDMLQHALVEWRDGKAIAACAASFEVTARVSWTGPEPTP